MPTGARTDAGLLRLLREEGDRDALALLFERCRTLAYRTALGVLRNSADAEGAAQEAFFRLVARAAAVRSEGSLAVLVARMALHVAQDVAPAGRCVQALRCFHWWTQDVAPAGPLPLE